MITFIEFVACLVLLLSITALIILLSLYVLAYGIAWARKQRRQ